MTSLGYGEVIGQELHCVHRSNCMNNYVAHILHYFATSLDHLWRFSISVPHQTEVFMHCLKCGCDESIKMSEAHRDVIRLYCSWCLMQAAVCATSVGSQRRLVFQGQWECHWQGLGGHWSMS